MAKIQLTLFASSVSTLSRGNDKVANSQSQNQTDTSSIDAINQHHQNLFSIEAKSTYEFHSERQGTRGSSSSQVIVQYEADQVVELEMADGGILYMRLDELQELVNQNMVRPSRSNRAASAPRATTNTFELSSSTVLGGGKTQTRASRGFVADFIKSISFPDIKWSESFNSSYCNIHCRCISRPNCQ